MDFLFAKVKLDHVINRSRVEMYKPIQIAETLRASITDNSIDLNDVETFRKVSRDLRDRVTRELIGKVSTSSMRFQDDLWNESAIPPEALVKLSEANLNHEIESYIYQHVWKKNSVLIDIRKKLIQIKSASDIELIFGSFNEAEFRTSADRLFEIFALSVLQTQLEASDYKVCISGDSNSLTGKCSHKLISFLQAQMRDVTLAKLGHTNAADNGLDIWSNFGVVVNVKNYSLDSQLLHKVLNDTPVGDLVIVCESAAPNVIAEVTRKELKREIQIITRADLFDDLNEILSDSQLAGRFIDTFSNYFDREFPFAVNLEAFMSERGYQ